METFKIKGEFIQLNQLLKVIGWCDSGGNANMLIDEGKVKVNEQVELRRRNKIFPGFKVEFDSKILNIK
jgi:ribosome-associated protein